MPKQAAFGQKYRQYAPCDGLTNMKMNGRPMPAYPMGKMGNCPGPRAQGGPALAEGVIENVRKGGKEKEKEKSKKK